MMKKLNFKLYRMLNLSKKHNYIFTYLPYDEYRRLSHFTRHLSTAIDKNPFLAPIPIRYIRSKDKPFTIQFNIEELYRHSFIKIVKTIPKDVAYTVFTKLRYNVKVHTNLTRIFSPPATSRKKKYLEIRQFKLWKKKNS